MVTENAAGFKREYFLDYNGAAITVWGSLWSGLMIVYYNDVEVGRSRAFGLSQAVAFEIEGKSLQACLSVKNILTDKVSVMLTEDGEVIAETTQAMFGEQGRGWWPVVVLVGASVLAGIAIGQILSAMAWW